MAKKFTPYKPKNKVIPPVAPAINMHTIEKYVENTRKKAWDDAVEVVSSAFHIVLSDKNGLTKEQLKKVSDDVFTQLECVVGGYVTVDELKQICRELGVPTDEINQENINKSIEETKQKLKEYEEMKKVANSIDELADIVFDGETTETIEKIEEEAEKLVLIHDGAEKKKNTELQIEKMTKITGRFGTYVATNGILNMKIDFIGSAMDKSALLDYINELNIVAENM